MRLKTELVLCIFLSGPGRETSPAKLASAVDVLLTALPAPQHVRAAMEEGGALKAMKPGSMWIDHTSTDPEEPPRLAKVAAASGVRYVEVSLCVCARARACACACARACVFALSDVRCCVAIRHNELRHNELRHWNALGTLMCNTLTLLHLHQLASSAPPLFGRMRACDLRRAPGTDYGWCHTPACWKDDGVPCRIT